MAQACSQAWSKSTCAAVGSGIKQHLHYVNSTLSALSAQKHVLQAGWTWQPVHLLRHIF